MYDVPVNINTYDPTSDNAREALRAVKEGEGKRKLTFLEMFNDTCAGVKDLIIYEVGEHAVVAIKKRYIRYKGATPKKIMHKDDEVRLSQYKKMGTIHCGIPPQT